MNDTSDLLEPWVDRLLRLAEGIPADEARRFVHDLYAHAQSDLDEERAEADLEREE
ncbi:hypothetical protein GCM10010377_43200 [Streptomyces viridiviolaceus]|uniref:Uncharacterized protein n=1 Tax=Streptomyces viridiviolaceus TaxID=68282 RepID=A0ABW2ECH1_9ACTN|nr:hypothetical protein [Streptomyces viridiviolaceus]GHB47755.1 hypothetical protein GCM10010377_43200 [Streptomyces viridiviolaceus]